MGDHGVGRRRREEAQGLRVQGGAEPRRHGHRAEAQEGPAPGRDRRQGVGQREGAGHRPVPRPRRS